MKNIYDPEIVIQQYRLALVAVEPAGRRVLWTTDEAYGGCFTHRDMYFACHAALSVFRKLGMNSHVEMVLQPRMPTEDCAFAPNLSNEGVPRAAEIEAMTDAEHAELCARLVASAS